MLKNHIGIVLDESGSMSGIQQETLITLNELIETLNSENKKHKQRTELTFVKFNNSDNYLCRSVNIKNAPKLDSNNYQPHGMTALFDAVGNLIEYYKSLPDYKDEDCSFLLLVITDGIENLSRKFDAYSLTELLKKVHQTNHWTVTFQVPQGSKSNLLRFGIPSDNIKEWKEGTDEGMREIKTSSNLGLTKYFSARSSGQTKLDTFYVTTDLSKVDTKIVNKMEDLSKDFKVYNVAKEAIIKQFVESRTLKPYVLGEAFYQVMKTELIQATKNVVIMDKTTKHIYGGDDARRLLGLKPGANVKVNPGNHANWELFCESRSVNRKLPRGTKILIKS